MEAEWMLLKRRKSEVKVLVSVKNSKKRLMKWVYETTDAVHFVNVIEGEEFLMMKCYYKSEKERARHCNAVVCVEENRQPRSQDSKWLTK